MREKRGERRGERIEGRGARREERGERREERGERGERKYRFRFVMNLSRDLDRCASAFQGTRCRAKHYGIHIKQRAINAP